MKGKTWLETLTPDEKSALHRWGLGHNTADIEVTLAEFSSAERWGLLTELDRGRCSRSGKIRGRMKPSKGGTTDV